MPFHRVVDEWDVDLAAGDPIGYPGYAERLATVSGDSVRSGRTEHYAFVEGRFDVFGGTMGVVAGERVVRAYDRALELGLPMVVVTRTGGARVQEGMVALIQLPRTAAAAERHARGGLLQLALHASPTTGGVFVSYASLADLRVGHPGATIGFAGPRVAESTLGVTLPPGSHTAESLYDHGLLDDLVDPGEEAAWVDAALGRRDAPLPTRPLPAWTDPGLDGAWGEVVRARAVGRPTGIDRAARLCGSWTELRGADPVVRAALATVGGRRVVVIATDRYAGAGRPGPDAYRLAVRAVELAGRLGLPLVTIVDTPGADPSPEAEAHGIGAAIAETFAALASAPVPIVSVCVGEGGSGGALALSVADRLLIQEHAVFSVIGPEGAAEILERDASQAPVLADRLRLTSTDLLDLGIVDEVIADGQDALDAAVTRALDVAEPGDRIRRLDAATFRWLR
jgi:acetyl-CoA carboxylase carboxyl transferase subunit beta